MSKLKNETLEEVLNRNAEVENWVKQLESSILIEKVRPPSCKVTLVKPSTPTPPEVPTIMIETKDMEKSHTEPVKKSSFMKRTLLTPIDPRQLHHYGLQSQQSDLAESEAPSRAVSSKKRVSTPKNDMTPLLIARIDRRKLRSPWSTLISEVESPRYLNIDVKDICQWSDDITTNSGIEVI